MKNLILLFCAVFLATSAFAQSPEKMSYQSVVRDIDGVLVSDSDVGVQISILQGSSSGTPVFVETHAPSTNDNGLFSVQIGSGILVSGSISDIDWGAGPYFLKTETDPTGGTDYDIIGTSELLSVPFALYAANGGVAGPEGPAGQDGEDGAQGPTGATGPQGNTGPQGPPGDTGPQGEAGSDGTGVTILGSFDSESELPSSGDAGDSYLIDGDLYVWSESSSSWENVGTIQGPQGNTGPQGPQGNTGPQGATGPQGPAGPQGNTGATGSQGPQGDTGPQGSTGPQGPQGFPGEDGATGATGSQGPQGNTGPQGPQGVPGEDGATGATGSQGPQGNTGSQGPQGNTGPQGPAGSANVSGTTNQLIKFTDSTTGGNSNLYSVDGNLGVGTATPYLQLSVGPFDDDSGFETTSDGNLSIFTNAEERIKIDQFGNVGIGTSTPTDILTISSQVTQVRLLDSDDGSDIVLVAAGSNYTGGIGTTNAFDLPLFTNNTDRLTIKGESGYIGIGTADPFTRLEVIEDDPENFSLGVIEGVSYNPEGTLNDIAGVYGENIVTDFWGIGVHGTGGYRGVVGDVYPTGSSSYYGVYGAAIGGNDGTNYGVFGTASGNGNQNYAGYFAGDLAYTGALIPASDERLKENIQTMDGALANVMQLRPTTYEFRGDENALMNLAEGHQFGFIAQEVGEVFPNLVHDNLHVGYPDKKDKTTAIKTEYIGLDYVSLIPVLTAAIQEQQAQLEAQRAQIDLLMQKVEQLQKK